MSQDYSMLYQQRATAGYNATGTSSAMLQTSNIFGTVKPTDTSTGVSHHNNNNHHPYFHGRELHNQHFCKCGTLHSGNTLLNAIVPCMDTLRFCMAQQDTQEHKPAADNKAIERELGQGAFGVVWSTIDPVTRERVAIKKVSSLLMSSVTAKRILREILIMQSLQHENIVRLLDIIHNETRSCNSLYLVTEYMQTDLHKIIVSSQPLSTSHVQLFVYQILRGVKYLHSAGIAHRDIKPGNMLVNSNCLLKICDFGLSRAYSKHNKLSRPHQTMEVVTQYYRAPELLAGCQDYTFAVDLWSVGCTFAELLQRKILFPYNNPVEHMRKIVQLVGCPNVAQLRYRLPHDLLEACRIPSNGNFTGSQQQRSNSFSATGASAFRACSSRSLGPDWGQLGQDLDRPTANLLLGLLEFNDQLRLTAEKALESPAMKEPRTRYHCCMCKCDSPPPPTTTLWTELPTCNSYDSGLDSGNSSARSSPLQQTLQSWLQQVRTDDSGSSTRVAGCSGSPVEPEPVFRSGWYIRPEDCEFDRTNESKIYINYLVEALPAANAKGYRLVLNPKAQNYDTFTKRECKRSHSTHGKR